MGRQVNRRENTLFLEKTHIGPKYEGYEIFSLQKGPYLGLRWFVPMRIAKKNAKMAKLRGAG